MKVLFIRYSALGDIVLTTGVIKAYHEKHPDTEIHVLTGPGGEVVFEQMPFVKQIFNIRKFGLLGAIKAMPKYDIVFDLQVKLKSIIVSKIKGLKISRLDKAGSARRNFVNSKSPHPSLNMHITQRYAEAVFSDIDIKLAISKSIKPNLANSKIGPYKDFDKPYIVIHPYASYDNKIWPYFIKLVDKLESSQHKIVIVGSAKVKLKFNNTNILDLTNKTSLKELFSIIKHANKVVTTDSGPLHIATAYNVPTVSIFGPTTKELGFYPVYSDADKLNIVLENNNLNCRPCHLHGGNTCPQKHFLCMKDISVENVLNAVLKV